MLDHTTSTLIEFTSPIDDILNNNPYARKCETLTDEDWTLMNIKRVLSECSSGRSFLQSQAINGEIPIWTSHYFEALKSSRRLEHLKWINKKLINEEITWVDCEDPISEHCPELRDFYIQSGDGHHHKAPIHEQKVDGKVYSTQHFYAKNLRNGMMWPIALAEYGYDRKKEHDMRVLKRQDIDVLRAGAPKGKKSLWLWDSACMCFPKWNEWKMKGIYFLTVAKKLNEFKNVEKLDFDQEDPINAGVLKNEKVESGTKGVILRRVTYCCPEGKTYVFLTNLHRNIRPGAIAFLYKCRWEIEKAYNTFKHKLHEQRAWAVSEEAKIAQSHFICLTYNLSLILNRRVEKEAPTPELSPNHQARKKQKQRIREVVKKCKKKNSVIPKLLLTASRLAELPKKFYIWLRESIQNQCSWDMAIERLQVCCARRY